MTRSILSIDPAQFEVLTFDCYGTLIDWEAGIYDALRPTHYLTAWYPI
ncbi:MAG: hypothetical protein KAT18_08120 [Candidatus Latescibacteria bacterium]|nr:hypothetical protein [Candidatus Latescibacterota bacterium]